MIALAGYLATAGSWLAAHAERRPPRSEMRWGRGSDAVGLFHNLTAEEERARVEDIRRWQRLKTAAGYGSISWPVEHGGAGLPRQYEAAFTTLERGFVTPPAHEAMTISLNIEAPTILALGNDEQRRRHVGPLRRTDEICCQLFSEPVAGSDLGAIAARAERDGDTWVINGQKVWTSGAHLADIGYLVARSDPGAPRQTALTVFLLDMDAPGVEVRPLRQMTGGVSFNEVFLTDVRLPDTQRLGDVGRGWHAMMTTLGYERAAGSSGGNDLVGRLLLLARHLGRNSEPVVRQRLARLYSDSRVLTLTGRRASANLRAGGVPGPEGSIGKLGASTLLTDLAAIATDLVGPAATADTGEWGTYAWTELLTGAPGLRIAGGTDEIQRNTIAERALDCLANLAERRRPCVPIRDDTRQRRCRSAGLKESPATARLLRRNPTAAHAGPGEHERHDADRHRDDAADRVHRTLERELQHEQLGQRRQKQSDPGPPGRGLRGVTEEQHVEQHVT